MPDDGGGDSFLTRKLGPLDAWQWGALAGIVVLFLLARRGKGGAGTTLPLSPPTSAGGVFLLGGGTGAPPAAAPPVSPPAGEVGQWGSSETVRTAYEGFLDTVQQVVNTGVYGYGALAPIAAANQLGAIHIGNVNGQGVVTNPITGLSLPGATLQGYASSDPYLYQGLMVGDPRAWQFALTQHVAANTPAIPPGVPTAPLPPPASGPPGTVTIQTAA